MRLRIHHLLLFFLGEIAIAQKTTTDPPFPIATLPPSLYNPTLPPCVGQCSPIFTAVTRCRLVDSTLTLACFCSDPSLLLLSSGNATAGVGTVCGMACTAVTDLDAIRDWYVAGCGGNVTTTRGVSVTASATGSGWENVTLPPGWRGGSSPASGPSGAQATRDATTTSGIESTAAQTQLGPTSTSSAPVATTTITSGGDMYRVSGLRVSVAGLLMAGLVELWP